MNSNIDHFSNVIATGESGFLFMTAIEVDRRHDTGHKWAESALSHSDLWSLDPDDEETSDDGGEEEELTEEEFVEEEIEAVEPSA